MDQNDTIGPEYFENLEPAFRNAVQRCRSELVALGLDIRRRQRTGGPAELRARLAERWPALGDVEQVPDDAFMELVLVADVWDIHDEHQEEQARRRAEEHPGGKWSLDQLREALAKSKPGRYGRTSNAQLAEILRKEGIPVQTIRIGNRTHKGIRKADVDRLFAERKAGR